jgi:predicted ArsR family transcriptional regulator
VTDRYEPPRLPEESVLELEDYLAMQRAVSEETRYRIVAELLREGELSATELADALDLPSNRLHYHLDKLTAVGVLVNRVEKERGTDGLYSYYVATSLGEAVMEHGIGELIRTEWNARERYA